MKLSTFMVVSAVVALVFALGFLLIPGTVLTLYGVTPGREVNLATQFYGVELFGIGLITYLARNVSEKPTRSAIVLSLLITDVLGLIVSLKGQLSGVFNAVGWSAVVIYALLALGFAYFQFMKPSSS